MKSKNEFNKEMNSGWILTNKQIDFISRLVDTIIRSLCDFKGEDYSILIVQSRGFDCDFDCDLIVILIVILIYNYKLLLL